MLAGESPMRALTGKMVKEPDPFNPPWSYHLDPRRISFFDIAIEVCDASIAMVEARLDEACGPFLPN
jgi:hypothetical protein